MIGLDQYFYGLIHKSYGLIEIQFDVVNFCTRNKKINITEASKVGFSSFQALCEAKEEAMGLDLDFEYLKFSAKSEN